MTDILVDLPDGLGSISFPAGTPADVMNREASNAYLRARGATKGKADATNKTDATAQAFGGGVLQGAGDEATAFVRSRLPEFSNWMMKGPALKPPMGLDGAADSPPQTVSDAPTAEGRYEEELARERAKSHQFRQDNPKTSIAATVAGSIAPMIPLGVAGVPLAPSMSGGFVGNTVKAAGTGAVYGALNGFNEGEGGFENRAASGGKGAAVGAALAPPLMWAGQGGRALLDYAKTTGAGQSILRGVENVASGLDRLGSVKPKSLSAAAPDGTTVAGDNMATYAADQIRSAIPAAEDALKSRAAQYIATAVERGEMTVEQAAASLEKLGAGGVLADVSKSLFRVARMTNTLPGKTENVAEKVLTDRATTYNPRLRSSIEGPNPPPEDVFFRGDLPEHGGNILDKTAREVGQRAYQGEMVAGGLKQSPEMLQIMSNPKIQGAWDRVMASLKEARIGTDRAPEAPVEIMHMIKREIQNLGLEATGRPSSTAYQWQRTADDFVKALKSANPKLAEADVAYAKAKGLPDAYEAGIGTWNKGTTAEGGIDRTAAAVENMMKSADAMKGNAAEFGAINAGRAKTGGNEADAVSFARNIMQSDEIRRKVKAVFGDRADEIFASAEAILRFNKTKQGVLGGSQTADKAAESILGGIDPNHLSIKATPGGIVPRFFETAGDIIKKVTAPNEATRNQIGSMMFSPVPGTNAETLAMVDRILRQRAGQRQGGAVWGGLAGGNASSSIP